MTVTTRPAPTTASRGSRFTGAAANYIDERTSMSGLVKELGRKIFPDHWSFMLGEVALYSFVAILLSGTFLTRPLGVTFHGSSHSCSWSHFIFLLSSLTFMSNHHG